MVERSSPRRATRANELARCIHPSWPLVIALLTLNCVSVTNGAAVEGLEEELLRHCTQSLALELDSTYINKADASVRLEQVSSAVSRLVTQCLNLKVQPSRALRVMVPKGGLLSLLQQRALEYENMTGVRVVLNPVKSFEMGDGARQELLGGASDGWILDSSSVGELAGQNVFKALDEYLPDETGFSPTSRTTSTTYNGQVVAVPLGGELFLMYYRRDLFARYNLTVPVTFEEFVTLAKTMNNTDTDGDGQGDLFGFCFDGGPPVCKANLLLAALAAPRLQDQQGSTQGWFLDPKTMLPSVDNLAVEQAVEQYLALWALQPKTPTCESSNPTFKAGKCLMTMNWGEEFRANAKTHGAQSWLGAAPLPGVTAVLDRTTGQLVTCTGPTVCPYAKRTQLANGSTAWVRFAPYSTYGGWSAAVNSLASPSSQRYAFEFFSYVASQDNSKAEVLNPLAAPSVDPVRSSRLQLEGPAFQRWLDAGYEEVATRSYLNSVNDALESAQIPLGTQLQYPTLPYRLYLESGLHNLTWYAIPGATVKGVLQDIQQQMEAALKVKGSRTEGQTGRSSTTNNGTIAAAVAVAGGVACLAFLLTLTVWWRVSHGQRRRPAAGGVKAPGVGPGTTLLVTDIESSTALWEILPEDVMAKAVEVHHSVIRAALLKHAGYESATEGDSFVAAFHSATEAVQCALTIQQELLMAPWPPELLDCPACPAAAEVCLAPGPTHAGVMAMLASRDAAVEPLPHNHQHHQSQREVYTGLAESPLPKLMSLPFVFGEQLSPLKDRTTPAVGTGFALQRAMSRSPEVTVGRPPSTTAGYRRAYTSMAPSYVATSAAAPYRATSQQASGIPTGGASVDGGPPGVRVRPGGEIAALSGAAAASWSPERRKDWHADERATIATITASATTTTAARASHITCDGIDSGPNALLSSATLLAPIRAAHSGADSSITGTSFSDLPRYGLFGRTLGPAAAAAFPAAAATTPQSAASSGASPRMPRLRVLGDSVENCFQRCPTGGSGGHVMAKSVSTSALEAMDLGPAPAGAATPRGHTSRRTARTAETLPDAAALSRRAPTSPRPLQASVRLLLSGNAPNSSRAGASSSVVYRGLRVRIGMASGLAEASDIQYNQAEARYHFHGACMRLSRAVQSAAAGGQVLLSDSTFAQQRQEQQGNAKPQLAGVLWLHMGQSVLPDSRDLPPQQVYQAIAQQLAGRLALFPPLTVRSQLAAGVLGAPVGYAAIAFVYAVGASTLLAWNAPVARQALDMMEALFVREVAKGAQRAQQLGVDSAGSGSSGGAYIVEATGSHLLAAFSDPAFALSACLETMAGLPALDWPAALLENGLCEELAVAGMGQDGVLARTVLFRGLRMKAGLDWGPVRASINGGTGRVNYRGRVMNRAARIASSATRGQVLCSRDLWQSASSTVSASTSAGGGGSAGQLSATPIATAHLKGLAEPVELMLCRLSGSDDSYGRDLLDGGGI